jgi:hypothetical protein
MVLPLRVTVSPERADAAPGDSLTLAVNIRNASDIVEHYGVEVLGLPDGATARTEPEVAKLRPAESADLTVHLAIPEKPPAPAGSYVLGVLARSRYRDDVSRCVEVPLTLAAVEDLTVRAAPEVVNGGRYGRFTVEVVNGGNGPVRLRLAATDPERRVNAVFEPATVDLPPGTAAQTLLTVHAAVPWSKEKQRQLTIEASGADPGGGPAVVRATGTATFVQRPRFASKLTRVAGVAGAVAVVAGAVVAAAVIARPDKPDSQASATTAATAPATTGASATTPAEASSAPTTPPSAGESPPTTAPGGNQPREVDLTKLADGQVASDAFQPDGFLVSADPNSIAIPGCEAARATVVTEANQRFLTSSLPTDATRCHEVPLLIAFLQGSPAGAVEVVPITSDVLEMEVVHRDLSRTVETDLKADADPARQGIVSVLVRPRTGAAVPAPVELRAIRFTPAG